MNFVSEDKKQINLPVPLGTTVYSALLDCFDGCLLQKQLFDLTFEPSDGRCGKLPCYTRIHSVHSYELSLSNLDTILELWGDRFFATEKEAKDKATETVINNIKTLKEFGFIIKDEV